MDNLPIEIIRYIFSFITEWEDVCSVSLVCKLFNENIYGEIISINNIKTLTVNAIRKLTRLQYINSFVQVNDNDIDYISSRKFKRICLKMPYINNIKSFLENNSQFEQYFIRYGSVYFSLLGDTWSSFDPCIIPNNIGQNIKRICYNGSPPYEKLYNKFGKLVSSCIIVVKKRFIDKLILINLPEIWNIELDVNDDYNIYCNFSGINYSHINFYLNYLKDLTSFQYTVQNLASIFVNGNFDNVVYNNTLRIKPLKEQLDKLRYTMNFNKDRRWKDIFAMKKYNEALINYSTVESLIKQEIPNHIVIIINRYGLDVEYHFKVI